MALLKTNINDLDICMALDPAISESLKAARTAIVVAGITPASRIIVLDYWIRRQGDPAVVIDECLNLAERWKPRLIGIETIAYQKALLPYMTKDMKRRNIHVPIIELKPDRNGKIVEKKNQRILSMQPFFKTGQVYIQKGMLDLIEEYETFPLGATVDILDALSYLFRLLVPDAKRAKGIGEGAIERLAAEDPQSARYWRAYGVKKGWLSDRDAEELDDDAIDVAFKPGVGELVS